MESQKVHLVCSSGGVKCFSYIGAIQKLLENNIQIASVSACSMGSFIGAMLCSGMSTEKMELLVHGMRLKRIHRVKFLNLFNLLSYPFATHKTPDYSLLMKELLGDDITLGQMKIPFSVAALDIRQKRFLVYSSDTHPEMRVSEVIKIATAIPFLYEPYKIGKRLLVDAAVASESPVWMAASYPGNYPIVILKQVVPPNDRYRKNFFHFLGNLINASNLSHDHFMISQTPRSIEVNILCENIPYNDFKITPEQIESLIIQGQTAMEQKLREFNYSFNHILEFEEVKSTMVENTTDNRAEMLADRMITNYQNEIIRRNQIFISYSRKDAQWLEKLRNSLNPLERYAGIKAWHDQSIEPGTEWNREIEKALVTAKLAVFLVTPNFLSSEFIQEKEMKYFLDVSKKENVPIVWIAVSDSVYEFTPLKDIECANDPKMPLDKMSDAEQNTELTNICKVIVKLMGKNQNA